MLSLFIGAVLLSVTADVQSKFIDAPQIPAGITVHKVIKTWEQADQQCKSEGAVLASPSTTELLNIMKSLIGIHNTPYFIGTKSADEFGSFTSVEGVALDNMTAAVMEMIIQLDPRDGDCLSMDKNKISVVPCCKRLPFICYKAPEHSEVTTTKTVTTTEEIQSKNTTEQYRIESTTDQNGGRKTCPTGYDFYTTTVSCYKLYKTKKSWDDASSICQSDGGHLVVIDNANEVDVLKFFNLGPYPHTYIGLRDYTGHDDWRSVTGKRIEDIYHKWENGQPVRELNDSYDCALLRANGNIDDFICSVAREFICEI